MYNINLTEGGHHWLKQNLTTIFKGRRSFDIFKCKNCGIKGKTTSLATIALKGSYSEQKVFNCNNPDIDNDATGKRIKIINCDATGKVFENLKPDSEHDVIAHPEGEHNRGGVWVMGVGEPAKVLDDEFEYIN